MDFVLGLLDVQHHSRPAAPRERKRPRKGNYHRMNLPQDSVATTLASPSPDLTTRTIAYFSMEIALSPALPTYSGGLGMLAGDTLRSAADTSAPIIAVSLAHRRGYSRQHLDHQGQQTE